MASHAQAYQRSPLEPFPAGADLPAALVLQQPADRLRARHFGLASQREREIRRDPQQVGLPAAIEELPQLRAATVNLHPGDHLRTPSGGSATVAGGHIPEQTAGWMWDLTIPGDHDFYIDTAATTILAHNCPAGPGGESPKVSDILKGKLGSIMRAPLPSGSPAWSDIMDMTMEEVRAAARSNQPGFKTILKLLTDSRFNK